VEESEDEELSPGPVALSPDVVAPVSAPPSVGSVGDVICSVLLLPQPASNPRNATVTPIHRVRELISTLLLV